MSSAYMPADAAVAINVRGTPQGISGAEAADGAPHGNEDGSAYERMRARITRLRSADRS